MTAHIPDTEKAQRVFAVLNQRPRPRCTLDDLVTVTGMSNAQVRKGWKLLREQLGEDIACMEPHRENSVYFLSAEFNDGARYMIWQARHLYTRITSAMHTAKSLRQIAAQMEEAPPKVDRMLTRTDDGLSGARAGLSTLMETMAPRAGMSDDELSKILDETEAVGA